MNPNQLRQLHANQIFLALRANPDISQRDICRITGFDKSTVSVIINRFEQLNLIERLQRRPNGLRGRPLETLRISANAGLLAGIHINFDRVVVTIATIDGEPYDGWEGVLPDTPNEFVINVTSALYALTQKHGRDISEIRCAGLCLPGLVDENGVLVFSSYLNWIDVDIPSLFREALPLQFHTDNDTNAAALAEHLFGACTELDDFLLIESSSGIGGGLYLDGRIYRGNTGFAGELGHLKVVPNGHICPCGASGCLAAYATTNALLKRAERFASGITNEDELFIAARDNVPGIRGLLEEAGGYVGLVLSNLINSLNPPAVVLSGNLSRLWPWISSGVMRALTEGTLRASLQKTEIIISKLSTSAYPLGGIALALEGYTSNEPPYASTRQAAGTHTLSNPVNLPPTAAEDR